MLKIYFRRLLRSSTHFKLKSNLLAIFLFEPYNLLLPVQLQDHGMLGAFHHYLWHLCVYFYLFHSCINGRLHRPRRGIDLVLILLLQQIDRHAIFLNLVELPIDIYFFVHLTFCFMWVLFVIKLNIKGIFVGYVFCSVGRLTGERES